MYLLEKSDAIKGSYSIYQIKPEVRHAGRLPAERFRYVYGLCSLCFASDSDLCREFLRLCEDFFKLLQRGVHGSGTCQINSCVSEFVQGIRASAHGQEVQIAGDCLRPAAAHCL